MIYKSLLVFLYLQNLGKAGDLKLRRLSAYKLLGQSVVEKI